MPIIDVPCVQVMFPWKVKSALKNDFFMYAQQDSLGVGGLGAFAIWLDAELLQVKHYDYNCRVLQGAVLSVPIKPVVPRATACTCFAVQFSAVFDACSCWCSADGHMRSLLDTLLLHGPRVL